MPALPDAPRLDEISRKWLDFAERRQGYYDGLYRNGRWERYFTAESFAELVADVDRAVTIWRRLAGQAQAAAADKNDLRSVA